MLATTIDDATNKVADTWTYNAYGQIASYEAHDVNNTNLFTEVTDTVSNPRDQLGRILRKVETFGTQTHTYDYGYDALNRLASFSVDSGAAETFDYDDNGNRKATSPMIASGISRTLRSATPAAARPRRSITSSTA